LDCCSKGGSSLTDPSPFAERSDLMNAELESALRKSFETLTRDEMLNLLIVLMDEGLHGKATKISEGHRRNNPKKEGKE